MVLLLLVIIRVIFLLSSVSGVIFLRIEAFVRLVRFTRRVAVRMLGFVFNSPHWAFSDEVTWFLALEA